MQQLQIANLVEHLWALSLGRIAEEVSGMLTHPLAATSHYSSSTLKTPDGLIQGRTRSINVLDMSRKPNRSFPKKINRCKTTHGAADRLSTDETSSNHHARLDAPTHPRTHARMHARTQARTQ